jgi:hypothetical protein
MAQPIIPVARPLVLCERYVRADRGNADLLGVFSRVSPLIYPHLLRRMIVVAHLSGGLGIVNTAIEIRYAASEELVAVTPSHEVAFPSRDRVIRLANTIEDVTFVRPGVYLVELHCEHMCIADARLILREPLVEQQSGGIG